MDGSVINLSRMPEPVYVVPSYPDPHVLVDCQEHGSFVALESQLRRPCTRCKTGRKPERFDMDPHPGPTFLIHGEEYYERTGATILADVRNREVDRKEAEVAQGIEAGLAWCEGSERQ